MAIKIEWTQVISPIDAIDAELKKATGVSIKEKIAKRKNRNPMAKEYLFCKVEGFGCLPIKTVRGIH